MLYHLVTNPIEWDSAGEYHPASLETEGFVHLSFEDQVAWVANQFLKTAPNLWVVEIDPSRLLGELRVEDPGVGKGFPHLYGPILRPSVVRVFPLTRSGEGEWVFPVSS